MAGASKLGSIAPLTNSVRRSGRACRRHPSKRQVSVDRFPGNRTGST